MTLDQALLIGVVGVTSLGVVIAYLGHLRGMRWRSRDLLRGFILQWAGEIAIPGELETGRWTAVAERAEADPKYSSAWQLLPRRLKSDYTRLQALVDAYVQACLSLQRLIEATCTAETGAELVGERHSEQWPARVLDLRFPTSIMEEALGLFRDEYDVNQIEYHVTQVMFGGANSQRLMSRVHATYAGFSDRDLAYADEEANLALLGEQHRALMERARNGEFTGLVSDIADRKERAGGVLEQVQSGLHRLSVE